MSIKAIEWAWKQNISPTQKLVLLAMANGAGDNGVAWISTAQLVEMTSLSERAVKQAKADLKKLDVLKNTANFPKQCISLNMKGDAR